MNTYLSKYPRTPHLPFSSSKTADDISGEDWSFFSDKLEVIVTEKMDGECTTFYGNRFHARSMDSQFHPSRGWVAGLWGGISWMIPEWRRVVLENVYAEHSIRYDALETFAFGICVIDLLDESGSGSLNGVPTVLGWDETVEIFEEYGITPVPVLHRGLANLEELRGIYGALDFNNQEGIVVRTAGRFLEEDFGKNVGKAVRPGHVQTDEHWMRTWKPNSMRK